MSWKGTDRKGSNGLQRSHTFPMPLLKYSQSEKRRHHNHPHHQHHTHHNRLNVQRQQTTSAELDNTPEFDIDDPRQVSPSLGNRNGMNVNVVESSSHDTMRVSYCRREVKKAKKLSIIVLFFMICWMPLYTLNFLESFQWVQHPVWLLDTLIILSHLNSAVNPLLYAYHMKDFREAFRRLLCMCVLRAEDLRDIRRRELVTITQSYNQAIRRDRATAERDSDSQNQRFSRELSPSSYPNSLNPTPEISFTG